MDNVIQFQSRKQKTEKTRQEIYEEMAREEKPSITSRSSMSVGRIQTVPGSLRSRVSDAVRFDNRSLQPDAKNQTGIGL